MEHNYFEENFETICDDCFEILKSNHEGEKRYQSSDLWLFVLGTFATNLCLNRDQAVAVMFRLVETINSEGMEVEYV